MGEKGRISHQLKQNDDNRISFIVLLFLCFLPFLFATKKRQTGVQLSRLMLLLLRVRETCFIPKEGNRIGNDIRNELMPLSGTNKEKFVIKFQYGNEW